MKSVCKQQKQHWCGIWLTGSVHIDVTCDIHSQFKVADWHELNGDGSKSCVSKHIYTIEQP